MSSVNHINMASIAKVCDTDVLSVQNIYNEIIAQLKSKLKKGQNIRLLFKFGRLATRNGEINWRQFNEDGIIPNDQRSRFSSTSTNFSRAMVNSCRKQQLSVWTPSVQKSRARSIRSGAEQSYHIANANP